MITLSNKDHHVQIENGELISYRLGDHEFIHQKGEPGWQHSDTEMFPIIGPTAEAGYRVHVPRGNAILDQHGLLRELDYELVRQSETEALFRKEYKAGTVVMNSKFPERSTVQRLIWPFEFQFEKHFLLDDSGLILSFHVSGEKDMPYMLGYHPAFKLHTSQPVLVANGTEIQLQEVLDVGSRALEVKDCDSIILKDSRELRIESEGFGHFMLWTEVPGMVCIEPISYYPYSLPQLELHEGFSYLESEEAVFKMKIIP